MLHLIRDSAGRKFLVTGTSQFGGRVYIYDAATNTQNRLTVGTASDTTTAIIHTRESNQFTNRHLVMEALGPTRDVGGCVARQRAS